MSGRELRRQTRVLFQGKLRLQAPGRREVVVARVQNLSPLGVFVTTTAGDLPEAGSEVSCALHFSNEPRIVRGRVAWVRRASKAAPLRSPGAGIEFLDLAADEQALLQRLVDPGAQEQQPVDVWFEGMGAPIRCLAGVTGQDVRLSTQLPFMRIGSLVKVAFSDQPGAAVREGRLDGAGFESGADGIPQLQINVSMSTLDNARGTIDVQSPPPLNDAGVMLSGPAPVAPSVTVDPAVTAVAPIPWLKEPGGALVAPPMAPPASEVPGAGAGWGSWLPLVIGVLAGAFLVSVGFIAFG